MNKIMKKVNKIKILFFILPLYSCDNIDKYEVDLKGKDVGTFGSFEVKKLSSQYYKINFNENNVFNGVLCVKKDTVFISFDSSKKKGNKILFINNKKTIEVNDTVFFRNNMNNYNCIIKRKKDGLRSDIIFYSKNAFSIGYQILFSFENGFLELMTQDAVTKEVLMLYPTLNYKLFQLSENRGYI